MHLGRIPPFWERGQLIPESRGYRWKNVGARIKEARLKAGFTQSELAQLLEVDPHTVWYWESGRMKPSADNLVQH